MATIKKTLMNFFSMEIKIQRGLCSIHSGGRMKDQMRLTLIQICSTRLVILLGAVVLSSCAISGLGNSVVDIGQYWRKIPAETKQLRVNDIQTCATESRRPGVERFDSWNLFDACMLMIRI